jgi:hypothetical protein
MGRDISQEVISSHAQRREHSHQQRGVRAAGLLEISSRRGVTRPVGLLASTHAARVSDPALVATLCPFPSTISHCRDRSSGSDVVGLAYPLSAPRRHSPVDSSRKAGRAAFINAELESPQIL